MTALILVELPPTKSRPSAVWKLSRSEDSIPVFLEAPLRDSFIIDSEASNESVSTPHKEAQVDREDDTTHHEFRAEARKSLMEPVIRPPICSQKLAEVQTVKREPRRFHLTGMTIPSPSRTPISKQQTHRDRKIQRKSLAIFVEEAEKLLQRRDTNEASASTQDQQTVQIEKARKRPIVSVAERTWRANSRAQDVTDREPALKGSRLAQSVDAPSHTWDYESPALAEQLHEIAFQECQAQQVPSHKQQTLRLKTQPKPPKARNQIETISKESSTHRNSISIKLVKHDGDDAYIFDTYVRANADFDSIVIPNESQLSLSKTIHAINTGVLIIDDEEAVFWENLGEDDQDSDPNWNSDGEDENGQWSNFPNPLSIDNVLSGRLLWQ